MTVWPVLLDSRPDYVGASSDEATLLGTSMGRSQLVSLLIRQITAVSDGAPTIVSPFGASPSYRSSMATLAPGATVVTSASEFSHVLAAAGPADLLLLVDPRCLPVSGWQLSALLAAAATSPNTSLHLVAFASDVGGTRECVTVDEDGLVRSVDRYYRPVTWPFIAGVAASVVPVSSGLLQLARMPDSLLELRERLVADGVPSHDVAITDGAFDLTDGAGMLAAMERSVLEAVREAVGDERPTTVLVGDGHAIDPTARLLGPIVVQAGARIEAQCTIVGPAIVGRGARISAGAVLAHVSVAPDAVVPAGLVLRDRVWFGAAAATADDGATRSTTSDRRPASFLQQLARHGIPATPSPSAPAQRAPSRFYPLVKRALDVAVSATALMLLAPLLTLIGAAVWLTSRGPIFYRDIREGVAGRQFACLKFRTMQVGASDLQRQLKEGRLDGPHFKMDADPRTTYLGRFLRAANLDELPQLVNVLLGDMSLVGPRPSPFRENQICVPWREGRLSVRPGITGLWQVCRHNREAGDFHQWIEYDLLYVQHMGLALDVKVLTATLLTLGGKYSVPVSRLLRYDSAAAAAVAPPPATLMATTVPGSARRSGLRHDAPARSAR